MNDDTRWRSLRTVNLHLASPVRSRWWAKLQSDFVPSLGRFGSNLLLQQLILKLDHGWSRLGMFIVLLVYILHGTALVIRVSLGVIWWRGAESCSSQTTLLVYIALIVRVASVVLLWEWDGSSVRGSRRQSRFSFSSVVLWWVWELHISGIYQVACSSVVDDAAISHFSTMEWPFGVSLWHCML